MRSIRVNRKKSEQAKAEKMARRIGFARARKASTETHSAKLRDTQKAAQPKDEYKAVASAAGIGQAARRLRFIRRPNKRIGYTPSRVTGTVGRLK